jgi:hypothetical protein
MSQQLRTTQQQAMVDRLVSQFGIDGSKVLFFENRPNEPWLRANTLASIARRSGLFKAIRVEHEKYIETLKQVFYQGTVVDLDDHIYSLPGVATVGKSIANTGEEVNADDLAESRALRSTLNLAGFDPLDPTSVVSLEKSEGSEQRDTDAARTQSRLNDNARIHILASERGLIVGRDYSKYRKFLAERYEGATSIAGFDPMQRKSVIEALERYRPNGDASMPPEFADMEGAPV